MMPRERIIKLMLLILGNPYTYTRKNIEKKLGITQKVFEEDIQILRNLNLTVEYKRPNYTYAILPEKGFKELEYLSPLSDKDRARITNALRTIPDKERLYLNKKLDSLYDFQKLGIRALRKPALEKIDRLEMAKKKEVCVILENYYSNSSNPRNRKVEPFAVDANLDTLQAYDVEGKGKGIRHFKLNRIDRVIILNDEPWHFKTEHHPKKTDVFRIADDNKVMVHLELDMQGRNVLLDTFPQAREFLEKGTEANTFDFQSEVNASFYGITNFILGNSENVTVIGPDSLKEHLQKRARKIIDKYNF